MEDCYDLYHIYFLLILFNGVIYPMVSLESIGKTPILVTPLGLLSSIVYTKLIPDGIRRIPHRPFFHNTKQIRYETYSMKPSRIQFWRGVACIVISMAALVASSVLAFYHIEL